MLQSAGANDEKLEATEHFLDTFKDYDSASHPNSESSKLLHQLQQPMLRSSDDEPAG